MRRAVYSLVFFICLSGVTFSQMNRPDSLRFKKQLFFSFGMGISMSSTPSLNDYLIDAIQNETRDSIKTYSVGIEFFGGLEYQIAKKFSIKLDYAYFFKGNTYYSPPFIYNISYHIHQPLLMGYYIFPGKGFDLKAGAGIGYSFAQLSKDVSGSEIVYTAKGPGMKIEALFDMQLSKQMYSYLSGFFTGNFIGDLKDSNGNNMQDPITHSNVNLNTTGFGLRLGLIIKLL